MSETIKSEMISRRTAFSLLGLAAAATVLTVSNAEAQTQGMERRGIGVQVGTSGVRRGAQVAMSGVTRGARVPRLRPRRRRRQRSSSPLLRSIFVIQVPPDQNT